MALPDGPRPMYRALRLCAQGGGLEALPERPLALDLSKVRQLLESAGFEVLDARVMLIVSMAPEVTISRSGRLLFKTADPLVAQGAFERLTSALSSAGLLPAGPLSG